MDCRQWKSNVAALILALVSLLYIFAPPGLFIAILIIVPLIALTILAWTTDTFREKYQ